MPIPSTHVGQYAWVDAVAEKWRTQQLAVCQRFGVERIPPDPQRNSGVSENIINGACYDAGTWPLHGCRYLPTPTTTGWYVWAGDRTDEADFFKPAHTLHLETWCADAVPYLGLPPGWRFLIAPDHEDVWLRRLSAGRVAHTCRSTRTVVYGPRAIRHRTCDKCRSSALALGSLRYLGQTIGSPVVGLRTTEPAQHHVECRPPRTFAQALLHAPREQPLPDPRRRRDLRGRRLWSTG